LQTKAQVPFNKGITHSVWKKEATMPAANTPAPARPAPAKAPPPASFEADVAALYRQPDSDLVELLRYPATRH
jgi:hypothetical protein